MLESEQDCGAERNNWDLFLFLLVFKNTCMAAG